MLSSCLLPEAWGLELAT